MVLDNLVFKVDAKEVADANSLLKELGVTMESVGAKITNTQQKQSQMSARAAKASKDEAKARLDNAKATDIEEKAEERKVRTTEKATTAVEKQTKAKTVQGEQSDKVVKLLKTEADILENLANGLSLGESKRVAYARSLGAQVEQERELIALQEQQRKFKSDPFDNSSSGLAKLNKELVQLQDSYRMNSAGLELTGKQSRELTRDKLRLIEAAKLEGNSILSVREQIRELNASYISAANSVNQLSSSERNSLNAKKEIASATRLVTMEDEKMAAALSATNLQMNKASSDLLVRYETGLRRMGLTQDEYTKKLGVYRGQLAQVQALEAKRSEGNLARALSPQLTDIGVSLYSGQAPLTVLLQQGGQIADLFRLSGVEAANFGKAMKDAFTSMIPVMATVAKGLVGLVGSVLADTGKGFLNLVSNITGVSSVLDIVRGKLLASGEGGQKFVDVLDKMGKVSALVAGVGLAALAAGVGFLAVGFVQAVRESDKLAATMFNVDAGFKASHREVLNLSTAMAESTGGSAKDFAAVLGQMAKQGNLAAEDIKIFGTVALDQMKYLGMSAEDVVKQYSEMGKEPVKNLQKLAEASGDVSVATLKYVQELAKAGEHQKAQETSIKELARVQKEQIEGMKENLSGFAIAIKNIGTNIGKFFNQAFDMLWKSADPSDKLRNNLEGIMQEIEKVSSMGDAQFRGDRTKYLKELQASLDAGQKELEVLTERNKKIKETRELNAENAKIQGITNDLQSKASDAADKELNKTRTLAQFREKFIEKQLKAYAKEKELDLDKIKNNKEILGYLQKQADVEYRKMHKKDGAKAAKQAAKDQEAYNDTLNKGSGLNATYNNTMESLQRMRAKGVVTEEEYVKAVEALIMQQPFAVAQSKEYNKVQELRNKLMDKAEGLGGEYTKTLLMIAEAEGMMQNGKKVFSADEISAMYEALERSTPAFKKAEKAIEQYDKAMISLQAETEKLVLASEKLSQNDLLSNMSPESAKVARIELEATNKAKEETIRLDKEIANFQADKKLSDLQKELLIQEAIRNSTMAQNNIIKEKTQAYQSYLDSLMGTSTEVLARLQAMAQASGQISFANAISSLGGLITTFDQMNAKQEAFNKLRQDAQGDSTKLAKLNEKQAQSQLGSYSDITKSMKGFFKEGSKGYKALNAAEKVFRTFEAAMAVKNAVLKIAQEAGVVSATVAGNQTMAASAVASSATAAAAKGVEAQASAVAAVANQGSGDPYTAFPRIAMMIALMAGIGLLVGGSSGRSTGGDGKMQYATGKGTVLGDKDAVSESIKNSLGILENVNTLTMNYSYQMLKSLRSIENTMTGVTSIILRSAGMDATAAGITEGTKLPSLMGILDLGSKLPVIGKLLGSLFGTKTTITGQGIYVNDASIQQIRDEEISAGYYTDVNKKKKLFGFTTSNRNSTTYKPSEELSQQFAKILNGFVDVVRNAGEVLGVSGDEIDNRLKDFVLKIGKIDLKDLKGDEIRDKLLAVFGAAGDDIARQALAGFEQWQQAGEGYLETVVRVANTVETVRASMDSMNRSMMISVENSMLLVEALGGLDKYTEATSEYIKNYYSEQEQAAILQRQVTDALKKHNIEMPKNKEEYRRLMEAQDLSTQAGRDMYAFLLLLSPAFAQVSDAAEDSANKLKEQAKQIADLRYDLETDLLRAQGKELEAVNRERKKELDALRELDPSLADLKQQIYDTEDAAKAATAAEKARQELITKSSTALTKAVAEEKKALQERITDTQASITALKSIFDLLTNSIKTLYNQVDSTSKMTYANARRVITGAVATVRAGGTVEGLTGLDTAVNDAMAGLSADDYATKLEYDRERLRLADELKTLQGTAKKELTNAEKQLDSLNEQVKRLDEILEYWQKQIEIANGTYISIVSVEQAVRDLHKALFGDKGAPSPDPSNPGSGIAPGNPGGSGATVGGSPGYTGVSVIGYDSEGRAKYSDGSTGKAKAGENIYNETGNVSSSGITLEQWNAIQNGGEAFGGYWTNGKYNSNGRYKWDEEKQLYVPAFRKGGNYAGGMALVGEEGPELINFGASGKVSTASSTSAMMEASFMRVEMMERAMLSMSADIKKVADYTKRTRDILINITPDGDRAQVGIAP